MARLPELLNISAARRVRLALPTARLAIIAFSFTLAAVGMGAFVATLPSTSAVDSVVDGAVASPDAVGDDAQRPDPTLQDDAAQDAASAGEGCVVGSLATGAADLTDAQADVSSRHLRVWRDEDAWWAMDLGSTNGSWLTPAGGERVRLEPGVRREVGPADELALGATTAFVLVEGLPS